MKLLYCLFLPFLSLSVLAQLPQEKHKAINAYVDYANQSADEMATVVAALIDYYPRMFVKSSWQVARYTCPVQLDQYYFNQAVGANVVLKSSTLHEALNALSDAALKVDQKCKALDTYHKLEDYKNDQYARASVLINEIQLLFLEYSNKQNDLREKLQLHYSKLVAASPHGYTRYADLMRKEMERERVFLNLWKYNLKEEVSTGWITDQLRASILETDQAIKALQEIKPVLKYPASSMWPSFIEAMGSILETKRSALDGYNHEARKSDHHQNQTYLSLINYFNGVLVADYNAFVGFASNDKYAGLKAMKYVPLFEIRDQAKPEGLTVAQFKDVSRPSLNVVKQQSALSKLAYAALMNYPDFINETWRQVSNHRDVIDNLHSSVASLAASNTFSDRAGLSFQHDHFQTPESSFQKTVTESKSLPGQYATVLNVQCEVLINILREIDQLGAAIEMEVTGKRYQADRLGRLTQMLERTIFLFEEWDKRKEQLFLDVTTVFDAYPSAQLSNSWQVSGTALRNLVKADRDALLLARSFYSGTSAGPVKTAEIDKQLREVLEREFENMKGIEKFGRYNGLCPYTPYEDIPKTSRTLSEYFNELKTAKPTATRYQHPYHSMVYLYNDVIDDYNKFCELSKVPLLKYIKQPELFRTISTGGPGASATSSSGHNQKVAEGEKVSVSIREETTAQKPDGNSSLVRDTVYIERRDTVWLHEPGEVLRSMEGYATNNMVVLLDVSGSMNAPEKFPLLKRSILRLLSMMRQEDEISVVIFSGKPKVILPATSFREEEKIEKAINALSPSGKTDANAALKLAYRVADENYKRGGNNRIVLATDGEFAISDATRELIEKYSSDDIYLSIFNFGNKGQSAKALQTIAAAGKGNYEFVSKDNIEMKLIREVKSRKKR